MTVEPPCANERGIETVGVVTSSYHNDAFPSFGSIDALEQCGDDPGTVLGIVVAEALPVADRVDFIQKDDGRRVPARLVEGLSHRPQHVA